MLYVIASGSGAHALIAPEIEALDELGYLSIKPEQANVFFKLVESRYKRQRPCHLFFRPKPAEIEATGKLFGALFHLF